MLLPLRLQLPASVYGLILCSALLSLGACTTAPVLPAPEPEQEATPRLPDGPQLNPAFASAALVEAPDINALATWLTPEGETWVIASAGSSGQLLVYDGQGGALLHRLSVPGNLAHPDGIAVHGDLLLVLERDAGRVALLGLPEFELLGHFGEGWLHLPRSLWLYESAPGELDVYVIDAPSRSGPAAGLQQVKRFRLQADASPIRAWRLGSFDLARQDGAPIRALAGDAALDRLLLGQSAPAATDLPLYTLDGRFREQPGSLMLHGLPEGLALYECPGEHGYWLLHETQAGHGHFLVLDRLTLESRGSFSIRGLTSRGGIALHPLPSERFPWGALYFIDAGHGIAALDWRDIAHALELWLDCPE